MFISKTRNIIIPQSQHAQLAGTVALLWGNDHFDRPEFDFDSFVTGVALHDLGHGFLDMNPIGAMDPEHSYKADAALVDSRLPDTVSDAVAHFHILRLLKYSGDKTVLIRKCEERIQKDIEKSGISREKYLWADRITEFCDFLSFDFCFDEASERTCEVYATSTDRDPLPIHLKYDGTENIYLKPWPLKVSKYDGILLGYISEGYPDKLTPVLRKYSLIPG
ncbi:MAG: DUF3891 family protein [Calditrichaceae bacterium]